MYGMRQPKINETISASLAVKQEIGWFDISMDDIVGMHASERQQQIPHVVSDVLHA